MKRALQRGINFNQCKPLIESRFKLCLDCPNRLLHTGKKNYSISMQEDVHLKETFKVNI